MVIPSVGVIVDKSRNADSIFLSTNVFMLITDINTIKARLKLKFRSVSRAKEEYESRIRMMEAPDESEKPIILSGKHTFETQLSHVLSQLS